MSDLDLILIPREAVKAVLASYDGAYRPEESAIDIFRIAVDYPSQDYEAMRINAKRYEWMRDTFSAAKGSASINVNEELAYYETPKPGTEVRLQWYPRTPISSYVVEKDNFDDAFDEAMKI